MSSQPAVPAPVAAGFEPIDGQQPRSSVTFPPAFGIVLRKTPTVMNSPYIYRLHSFLTRNAWIWSESDELFSWSCASDRGDQEWMSRKLEQAGLEIGIDFVQTVSPGTLVPAVSWLKHEPSASSIQFVP